MAQDITLLGATYSAVPAVQLPKSGGGTATFTDVSDTTATAADVASSKYFYTSSGERVVGTASGGGTATFGGIRPDAVLWKSYTYDKWMVADLQKTIPTYSTSTTTTFVASSNLEAITITPASYSYFVVQRCLTIPKYASGTSVGKGYEEYSINVGIAEIIEVPANTLCSFVNTAKKVTSITPRVTSFTSSYIGYWSSASAFAQGNSSYGASCTVSTPSATATTLTLKTPALIIRDSTSYLTQTYHNAIEDIRYQYRIEVYRAPNTNPNTDGWSAVQQVVRAAGNVLTQSQNLT